MSDTTLAPADTVDTEILLSVLAQVRAGDFTARMPLGWTGLAGKVADGLNEVILANEALGAELARVSQVVGKEGKTRHRVSSDRKPGACSKSRGCGGARSGIGDVSSVQVQ